MKYLKYILCLVWHYPKTGDSLSQENLFMENKNKSQRKSFIDISKGIGIYTVVLVHFTVHGSVLSQILLSFCVPLFFIISGMLFSVRRDFRNFLLNLIQKIIIPLLVYGVIDVFFTAFRYWVIEGQKFNIITLIKMIAKVFFVSGSANSNGPLWYLPTLAMIEIIMYPVVKSGKKYIPVCAVIFMFIVGYFIHFKGPFRVGQVPCALVYFGIGIFIKPYIMKLDDSNIKKLICPLAFIIFGISCRINGFSEMAALNYGKYYPLYFITAFSATIGIITLSMMINHCKILEFFGSNSLTVMCCHYYFARYIIPWILSMAGVENILENELVEVAFSVLMMGIMVFAVMFINKKVPVLNGTYRLKLINKIIE